VEIKNNNSTFTSLKDVPALFGPQIPLGGVTGVLHAALPIHGYDLADTSRNVIQLILYRTLVYCGRWHPMAWRARQNLPGPATATRLILNPRVLSYKAS
jgi:hypothetical protein